LRLDKIVQILLFPSGAGANICVSKSIEKKIESENADLKIKLAHQYTYTVVLSLEK